MALTCLPVLDDLGGLISEAVTPRGSRPVHIPSIQFPAFLAVHPGTMVYGFNHNG